MRNRIWIAIVAAAFSAQTQAAVVEENVRYSAYLLDVVGDPVVTPPPPERVEPFSRATAINTDGLVVGYYRINRDAANATARGFSAPPDSKGGYDKAPSFALNTSRNRLFAWDVNDTGIIVGSARRASQDPLYAFVKNPDVPIPGLAGRYGEAWSVNNTNAVVGYVCSDARDCSKGGSGTPSAFYYDAAGQTAAVVGLPDLKATASQARAINDKGLIAGSFVTDKEYRALRYDWTAQQAEDLHPYFDEAVSSEAFAINSRGDVAGRVGFADAGGGSGGGNTVQQAFALAQGSNTPILLETPTGYEGSAAAAIADNGWVVGTACASGKDCGRFEDNGASAKAEDNTAVLWVDGLAPIDLSRLPGLDAGGWKKLSFAESIVDMGEFIVIAGVGFFQGDKELQRRAFALRIDESSVPIPEPRTYAMLAAGLVALGVIRVRRAQRLSQ